MPLNIKQKVAAFSVTVLFKIPVYLWSKYGIAFFKILFSMYIQIQWRINKDKFWTRALLGLDFFIVFRKIWPNNRLASPLSNPGSATDNIIKYMTMVSQVLYLFSVQKTF